MFKPPNYGNALRFYQQLVARGLVDTELYWSPEIEVIQRLTGCVRQPYCAGTCAYVFWQSDGHYPWEGIALPAYVPAIVTWAQEENIWMPRGGHHPKPGDLVIWCWDGSGIGEHITMFESMRPAGALLGAVTDLEADTSDPDGSGRNGIFRKTRTSGNVLGYINWPTYQTPLKAS